MDIFERLRTRPLYEGCGEESNIPDDAADEIEQLRDALRWAAPYVKDDPRVSKIVEAALNEKA